MWRSVRVPRALSRTGPLVRVPIAYCARELSAFRHGTDQIPFVASDVEENGDTAIGFRARRPDELNTRSCHTRISGFEILHVEKEAHPAGGLLPDGSGLIFSVSSREQQTGRGTWRPDYYPPLGAPVIGQGRGVLHEFEAQRVHEEADRWVVFADHDGDKAKMHRASIGDLPCSRLRGAVPSSVRRGPPDAPRSGKCGWLSKARAANPVAAAARRPAS